MLSAGQATASPIADKRQQAVRVKSEVDALDSKLEMAVEDYNEASQRLRDVNRKVAGNQARLAALTAEIDTLQTSLGVRADSMYRNGPTGVIGVLLGATTFSDFASTWDQLNEMNEQEAASVAQLSDARRQVQAVAEELGALQQQAESQKAALGGRKSSIEAELAKRKRLVQGLEAEIAALEAADLARAQASARSRRSSPSGGWDWGDPSREPRSGVVEIAKRYLGRPYRWAASGPDAFDCSGFTMFVYAQVGVRLPHSSRAQINCGERVSRDNLQPGDLVFFGRPIHHVGIYVGGGMMIHSPRTGDVVKIAPLHSNYSGACRP